MTEQDLQSLIRIRLSELGWTVFRANVGKVEIINVKSLIAFLQSKPPISAVVKWVFSNKRWFDSGLPKGFSDLFACKDGQTVFIEVKVGSNKPSEEQTRFIENMKKQGFKAGAVWSLEDVERLIYD